MSPGVAPEPRLELTKKGGLAAAFFDIVMLCKQMRRNNVRLVSCGVVAQMAVT
jgi:hypothetical protein